MAMDQLYTDALTELEQAKARIAELEGDIEIRRAAEEMQIALRQKAEQERDALAAHIERFKIGFMAGADDEQLGEMLNKTPFVSLHRRDALKQAEEIQHLIDDTLHWADGHVIANLHVELARLRQKAEGHQ